LKQKLVAEVEAEICSRNYYKIEAYYSNRTQKQKLAAEVVAEVSGSSWYCLCTICFIGSKNIVKFQGRCYFLHLRASTRKSLKSFSPRTGWGGQTDFHDIPGDYS
jgi:hypothetical protein